MVSGWAMTEQCGEESSLSVILAVQAIYPFKVCKSSGGDRASVEPWRMAAAYLYDIAGEVFRGVRAVFQGVDPQMLEAVGFAMKRKIGCLLTSSAGRLSMRFPHLLVSARLTALRQRQR